jgi:hypothetical protein
MQNRTHPGDRRSVQIVQARTTRDRIRCNTTQCRTRGSRRRQRRRLKQAPPATPPGTPPARACSCPHRPFETFAEVCPWRAQGGSKASISSGSDSPPLAAGLFISS